MALSDAQRLMTYFNKYFSIKYPFGKLDIVAVPDFAAGAMENTAAIFYRETIPPRRSEGDVGRAPRKSVDGVLAHEMAHQWFGNLVTMAWWDDLWLNGASRPGWRRSR